MATLAGKQVDRPALSFYEINGLDEKTNDPDLFNIFNDPSWKPLIELARDKTDRIVMRSPEPGSRIRTEADDLTSTETWMDENGRRFSRTTIELPYRTLTQLQKRDRDINTDWTIEHLLKDVDDFEAWLEIPEEKQEVIIDPAPIAEAEDQLGDTGIVMLDTQDPLCKVASLFPMEEYTIIALTEPELMHRALQKAARSIYPVVEAAAEQFPGRLWRIYGPEYASPPYLPPAMFREYVTDYVKPMVDIIHRYGGYARIHSHGRLKDILDHIAATGCDGLDPIEPPHQGDVELKYVREKYGRQLVLFGNLEISDIENMPAEAFAGKVRQAIEEGTSGTGRGFVLMPSACPYGRNLPTQTLRNYEIMTDIVMGL